MLLSSMGGPTCYNRAALRRKGDDRKGSGRWVPVTILANSRLAVVGDFVLLSPPYFLYLQKLLYLFLILYWLVDVMNQLSLIENIVH